MDSPIAASAAARAITLSISIHFNMRTRIEPIQLIRIEQLRNKREKKVFVVLAVDGFY